MGRCAVLEGHAAQQDRARVRARARARVRVRVRVTAGVRVRVSRSRLAVGKVALQLVEAVVPGKGQGWG